MLIILKTVSLDTSAIEISSDSDTTTSEFEARSHHVIYIIYKAIVTTKNEIKQFVRSKGAPSKTRWYGHVRDFKVHKENDTKLSKSIWKLKNSNND